MSLNQIPDFMLSDVAGNVKDKIAILSGVGGVVEKTNKSEFDEYKADNATQGISLIPETLKKLQSGLDVLIEIVGDSVTLGVGATLSTCYVAIFTDRLKTLYPNSTIIRYDCDKVGGGFLDNEPIPTFTPVTIQTGTNGQTIRVVKNGVGGDTAVMLCRRIDNFTTVFQGKLPDLIIINVAINDSLTDDTTRYSPPSRFKWQLDSLIRNIKLRTNAEVALMTPYSNYVAAMSDYVKDIEEVANMNGLQIINAYQLAMSHWVSGAANSGLGIWGSDTWHPSIIGHADIGDLAFDTLFTNNQKIVPIKNSAKVYRYNDPMFVYGVGWIKGYVIDNLDDGLSVYTENIGTVGETVTFSVYGAEIAVLTRPSTGVGKFTFAIDGATPVEVDIHVSYPATRNLEKVPNADSNFCTAEKIIIATGLDDTLHTVVLTGTLGYYSFSGIEIIGANDVKNELKKSVTNANGYEISGVNTPTNSIEITFAIPHIGAFAPTVIPFVNDPLYYVKTGTITKTSVVFIVGKRDGSNFLTSESTIITFISSNSI